MASSELLARLKRICPDLYVIVLSARPEDRQDALACGADGFVSKMDQPDKLLAALDLVQKRPRPEPVQEAATLAEGRLPSVPDSVAPVAPRLAMSPGAGDGSSAVE
jgi:DNA-binding NarL/FixJ family response regulator